MMHRKAITIAGLAGLLLASGCMVTSVGPSSDELVGNWAFSQEEALARDSDEWSWVPRADEVTLNVRADGTAVVEGQSCGEGVLDWEMVTDGRIRFRVRQGDPTSLEMFQGTFDCSLRRDVFKYIQPHDPPISGRVATRRQFVRIR